MARITRQPTVRDVGEFGFLNSILRKLPADRDVLVGPGHDCALVRSAGERWLITIDSLVEDVHFRRAWLSPRQLGRRSFLVNASDIAAMGGLPRFCVVNFGVPSNYPAADLAAVQSGIVAAAREVGATVVGGNLSQARQLTITITLIGTAPARRCSRSGARPGDRIYLTGNVGGAAFAVQQWRRGMLPSATAARRYREPPARVAAGHALVESGVVTAMIDVSDGLVQDLGHLCAASGVAARVDAARVPLSAVHRRGRREDLRLAMTGGEDYELLCTVAIHNVEKLERLRARLGCPIRCIGEIVRGVGVQVVGADGKPLRIEHPGFDHFGGRR